MNNFRDTDIIRTTICNLQNEYKFAEHKNYPTTRELLRLPI